MLARTVKVKQRDLISPSCTSPLTHQGTLEAFCSGNPSPPPTYLRTCQSPWWSGDSRGGTEISSSLHPPSCPSPALTPVSTGVQRELTPFLEFPNPLVEKANPAPPHHHYLTKIRGSAVKTSLVEGGEAGLGPCRGPAEQRGGLKF